MVLYGDLECGVCYQSYSRSERIPRMLFCNHTFCSPCLETMAVEHCCRLNVRCPLCRQVSCVRGGLNIEEALWVNSDLWEYLTNDPEQDQEEQGKEKEQEGRATAQAMPPARTECEWRSSFKPYRLRMPTFLKRLRFLRNPDDSNVPACNVQMKSWRKLSTEETF